MFTDVILYVWGCDLKALQTSQVHHNLVVLALSKRLIRDTPSRVVGVFSHLH